MAKNKNKAKRTAKKAQSDVENFFQKNPWVLGIILVIVGPLIATQGLKFFPFVVMGVTGLGSFYILMAILGEIGLTGTTIGMWICIIGSLAVAILAALFIRKRLWIAIGALGAFGGFLGGVLLFDIIAASSGWGPEYAFWILAILFAILGWFLAIKHGILLVNLCTSFIGSFCFVRGLSCFFWTEHWPTEEDIINGNIEKSGWEFYVFLVILVVCTIAAFQYQKRQAPHAELSAYDRS